MSEAFIKPADLFKKKKHVPAKQIEAQSPLRCLNLINPSPVKEIPKLLKNPFDRPVKRKLDLGGFSPRKKTRIFEINEDANLEAPEFTNQHKCFKNDWTLKTKIKINFVNYCRNWNETITSTHKRPSIGQIQDSPSKLNDNTISIEAIRNVSTVYQHPYLAWLPLFPRIVSNFDDKKSINLANHTQITQMMHKDWCESLDDLANLLIDRKCPYFYMCSDKYNVLFRQTPSSKPKKPNIQVFVSPFSFGMASCLDKLDIEYKYPQETEITPAKENSQASFGSSTRQSNNLSLNESASQDSKQNQSRKISNSIDSGNVSDFDDDDDDVVRINAGNDVSLLESIGLSQQDFPILKTGPKGFTEVESDTQSRSSSTKPMAIITGVENLKKFIKFLQTNRLYTIEKVGKFACIPPTLLSPREFRLSTPQSPDVIINRNMIDIKSSIERGSDSRTSSTTKSAQKPTNTNRLPGPVHIELRGTILPNLYDEIHHLLSASDNSDHTCTSSILETSSSFNTIHH